MVSVPVKYGDQEAKLPALVIGGDGPNLFGRDWLKVIRINWSQIFKVEAKQQVANHGLQRVLEEHKEVFQEELGTLNGMEAKIYVDEKASPLYLKACLSHMRLRKGLRTNLKDWKKRGDNLSSGFFRMGCTNRASGKDRWNC